MRRSESWGHVVYDSELDEFEGHLVAEADCVRVDRPLSVGCLVTGRCPFACRFCYGNREALPSSELDVREWERIFAKLKSWGVMRVDLSGGEPTVRPDIGAILSAASANGLESVLSTTGFAWHASGPIGVPKTSRIHVSIDSGIPDVHESSRVWHTMKPSSGSLLRVRLFIQRAVNSGYRVRALTSIASHNQDQLFELGELLALSGVRDWNVSRILPAGRALDAHSVKWNADEAGILAQIRDIRCAYPWLRIGYSSRVEEDGYFLLVLPDGSVATQFTDSRGKLVLGQASDLTLSDILTNGHFDIVRHSLKWISAFYQCSESCDQLWCDVA